MENFAYGEINERSFSNTHSRWCYLVPDIDGFNGITNLVQNMGPDGI